MLLYLGYYNNFFLISLVYTLNCIILCQTPEVYFENYINFFLISLQQKIGVDGVRTRAGIAHWISSPTP